MMKSEKKNQWDEWDVRNAAETLIRAQSIQNDKRKGFYPAVLKELDKQVADSEKAAAEARIAQKLHSTFNKGK